MYMSKKRVDDGTFYGQGIAPVTAVSQQRDNLLRELFMEELSAKMSHLPACLEFERKPPTVDWMEDETAESS